MPRFGVTCMMKAHFVMSWRGPDSEIVPRWEDTEREILLSAVLGNP